MAAFEKISGSEAVTFEVNMSGRLPEGISLAGSGSTATAYDVFGRDVSSTLLASTVVATTPGDGTARFSCKSGTQPLGEYQVRLSLALSSGGPIIEDAYVYVRERTAQ